MSRADLLMFRRMRGIFDGLLIVGVIILPAFLVLGLTIPAQFDMLPESVLRDVGRPMNVIEGGFALAGVLASIGAVIMGATAGSVDLQRGVLRDLVLAGRSRVRVVTGRLLAAATWLLLFLAASYAITMLVAMTLAPLSGTTEWEQVARGGAQYVLSVVYTLPFAAGIALLVGSRGPAIAVFFVVTFIVDGVLGAIPKVGDLWREVSLLRADQEVVQWLLQETPLSDMSHTHAVLVLVGWATIPLAAGLIRLTRRDL